MFQLTVTRTLKEKNVLPPPLTHLTSFHLPSQKTASPSHRKHFQPMLPSVSHNKASNTAQGFFSRFSLAGRQCLPSDLCIAYLQRWDGETQGGQSWQLQEKEEKETKTESGIQRASTLFGLAFRHGSSSTGNVSLLKTSRGIISRQPSDPLARFPRSHWGEKNNINRYECLDFLSKTESLLGWLIWPAVNRTNLIAGARVRGYRRRSPSSDASYEFQWVSCMLLTCKEMGVAWVGDCRNITESNYCWLKLVIYKWKWKALPVGGRREPPPGLLLFGSSF